jgi:ATP-dependent Clp protease ATP-binding subunit ClpA
MARVIQEHIKKPLADEVLFGKLRAGGHVRVIVDKDEHGRDKLGFEYLDGPVTPKPEKLPEPRRKKRTPTRRYKSTAPNTGGDDPPRRGSVPKVPLVKV